MAGKSGFGTVRKLPSGRYQVRYTGPDGRRYSAPQTYPAKEHARLWLAKVDQAISSGTWRPPDDRRPADGEHLLLEEYAHAWLAGRDLKPRTRAHYEGLLTSRILPAFGNRTMAAITPSGNFQGV